MELIDRILSDENIKAAIQAVKSNKGAAGVDKMPVDALEEYFAKHGSVLQVCFDGHMDGFANLNGFPNLLMNPQRLVGDGFLTFLVMQSEEILLNYLIVVAVAGGKGDFVGAFG